MSRIEHCGIPNQIGNLKTFLIKQTDTYKAISLKSFIRHPKYSIKIEFVQ